jgi:putative transposase
VLKDHGIAISRQTGKGRWVENVYVERLRRSVKYEDVYLRDYETPADLRNGLARYFEFYNARRQHSALNRHTPDAVYYDQATCLLAVLNPWSISLILLSNFSGPFLTCYMVRI